MNTTRRLLIAPALLIVGLLLAAVKPDHAKWPTIDWVITEKPSNGGKAPTGERATIAEKHRLMLQSASSWYQSISFPAPYQINERRDLAFKGNVSNIPAPAAYAQCETSKSFHCG